MQLDYNIFFEASVLPIDLIICIYVQIKYGGSTKVSSYFKKFALFVTLGTFMDLLSCIVTSIHLSSIDVLHILVTFLGQVTAFSATVYFLFYVTNYIGSEAYFGSRIDWFNRILTFIYTVFQIQNLFTKNVFTFQDGYLVRGPLWLLIAFAFPLYFMVFGLLYLVRYRRNYRREQLMSLVVGGCIAIVFYLLQMLFFPNTLMTFYVGSLGLLLCLLTFETPDYSALLQVMDELKAAREREKEEREKADNANRAQNRFLTQMSHEIRTPLNAIIGYNELILKDANKSEEIGEYSEKIKTAAAGLLDFFKSVMNYVSEKDVSENGQEPPSVSKFREMSAVEVPKKRSGSRFADLVVRPGSPKQRILIVDDNDMNVDLLVRILKPVGITMDIDSNGKDAVDRLRHTHYDLIFMDHMMPVMDGMEAIKIIRATHLAEGTPIVMMTANTVEGEQEKYRNAGFADYVSKPFEEEKIYDILVKYLPLQESITEEVFAEDVWGYIGSIFSFLDIDVVRNRFDDDDAFFMDMLRLFAENDVTKELGGTYENRNIYRYSSVLQSLRENSELIGAREVAGMAKTCRNFIISGDTSSLAVLHPQLLTASAGLMSRVKDGIRKIDQSSGRRPNP